MGLFSETVTTVDSYSTRLVEDTPDLVKDSVYNAVLYNRSVADDLIANYLNGLAIKSDQMYRYAKSDYTYGLPNGHTEVILPNARVIKEAVEFTVGTRVSISFVTLETCNPDYFAREILTLTQGWNITTGIVANPPFVLQGVNQTPVVFTFAEIASATQVGINYEYTYTASNGSRVVAQEYRQYPVLRYYMKADAPYLHVTYYEANSTGGATGALKYWNYDTTSNVYPALSLPEGIVEDSPYYPIVPIREDNKDLTDASLKETELYKTSKTCLKKIGLDFVSLGEGVQANPDIGQVDHAYVILAVHLQSEELQSINYLFQYFSYLHGISKVTQDDFAKWNQGEKTLAPPPVNSMVIEDARFKVSISYTYITKKIVEGSLGELGKVVRTNNVRPRKRIAFGFGYETSSIVFQKQVAIGLYEEVEVFGLTHVNHIYKRYTVESTIGKSLNKDEDDFFLPININVAKSLGLMEHNYLMYDSIRIVFNSFDVRKLKWYETGFFKIVLIVIAIIITIYSLGTLSESMVAAYGAVAGGGAAAAIAAGLVLAEAIVWSAIYSLAAGWVVDALGVEFALIAAVLALAAGLTVANGTAVSGSVAGMPFSIDLIQISSIVAGGISKSAGEQISDIRQEAEELAIKQNELLEELNELYDALDNGLSIDPFEWITYDTLSNPYESPDEMYNRTIHAGNIGVLSLNAVSQYVESQLKLDIPESPIRTFT